MCIRPHIHRFLLQQTQGRGFFHLGTKMVLGQAVPWTLLYRHLTTLGLLSGLYLILHGSWAPGARLPPVPLTEVALSQTHSES